MGRLPWRQTCLIRAATSVLAPRPQRHSGQRDPRGSKALADMDAHAQEFYGYARGSAELPNERAIHK